MALISNSYMMSLLKTVYLSGVDNLKYQNSPVLAAIPKKTWGGGKEIKYAAQYGNGGNVGSVYSTVANNPTTGARNCEWKVEQGYAFGLFTINQPEILTSEDERGAYMSILSNKMAACFDALSKVLATYLYGGKWGVIDYAKEAIASVAASGNTLTLTSAGIMKLDVGSRFVIAGGTPDGTLKAGVMTVTAINDLTITFDASVTGAAVAIGDVIELYTARGSDGTARGIEGLPEILPTYANRTGATWTTYIGTAFRGVNRSQAVERLAGQFVKQAASGESVSEVMIKLLKKTKRAGGLNNIMIVNDETWDKIGSELGVSSNLWQATNAAMPGKQSVTAGVNELATAFGDAFIGRTVIDPYCPENVIYCLEKDELQFYDLGNVGRVIDPVSNGQVGKHEITAVGDQGFGKSFGSNVNIDKLFTVEQGAAGDFGPEFRIACHVFGNFILRKTASAGVAVLN